MLAELARKRFIDGLPGLRTPLVVPSFSSKSGTNRREQVEIERLAEIVDAPVLISAYDVFYGLVQAPSFAKAVFLDSGGFEALRDCQAADAGDVRGVTAHPWTEDSYARVLAEFRVDVPVVAVSFDHPNHAATIEAQLDRANRCFAARDDVVREFLIKPEPGERYLDPEILRPHVNRLASFPILGVTDKELGGTMLERLACAARLRRVLGETGSVVPIHVFGCLDPVTAPLYLLAGTDIFDGLSWLRYGFSEGRAVYPKNYEVTELDLHLRVDAGQFAMWTKNYFALVRLEDAMRRFLKGHDFACFGSNARLFSDAWRTLEEHLGD